MKGLDIPNLIKKHKDNNQLYALRNGESVVGQAVDADNRLVYIIKRKNGKIEASFAEQEQITPEIHPSPSFQETGKVALGKQPEEKVQGNPEELNK